MGAKSRTQADALKTALATIGKFVIMKSVGENGKILGTVSSSDIAETIRAQTGQDLDKKTIEVPTIDTLGTYDVSIKLHPEVTGTLKIVILKATTGFRVHY